MKYSPGLRIAAIFIMCVAAYAFTSTPGRSLARTATISVNIVNNSSRDIRNVYWSHVDSDDWSGDLLGDQTITAGQSLNVGNISCDGQSVKVIAEDQDGCFSSTAITCGGDASWTITNGTTRDCGD